MDLLAAVTASFAVLLLAAYAARTISLRPADQRLKVLSINSVQVERRTDGDAILRPGVSSVAFVGRYLDRRGYADKWRVELDRAYPSCAGQ